MPFRIALSGLNAATADLNVTANNIANSNTTGFKSSRAEFADVFAVGRPTFAATGRQRRAPREDRPAVRAGQHRLHRQQSRSRGQRLGLLHAARRVGLHLHAQRQFRRRSRRLRRQQQEPAPAGLSGARRRRLQHRHVDRPQPADDAEPAAGDDRRRSRRQSAAPMRTPPSSPCSIPTDPRATTTARRPRCTTRSAISTRRLSTS